MGSVLTFSSDGDDDNGDDDGDGDSDVDDYCCCEETNL